MGIECVGAKSGFACVRPARLRVYLQLSRPLTVASAFLVGLFLAQAYGRAEGLLLALMFAALQGAGQVVNQIVDVEIDRVNKPYRPLPRGLASKREAWALATLYMLLGLAASLGYGLRGLLVYLPGLGLALGYNTRVKRTLWVNLLWQALSRGVYPALAAYLLLAPDPRLLVLAGLLFLWVLAFQSTKDFPDVEGDRRYGVRTLPVAYGVERAKLIISVLGMIYALAGGLLVGAGLLPLRYGILLLLAFVVPEYIDVEAPNENNVAWNLYYAGLALHYLLLLPTM